MLARVTRVRVKPDHVEDAIQKTDSMIIPDIQDDTGLAAFYVLGDRESGETMVITMWDNQEDEEVSRAKVSQRFGMLADYLAGQPESPQTFEVLNSFTPSKTPTA